MGVGVGMGGVVEEEEEDSRDCSVDLDDTLDASA